MLTPETLRALIKQPEGATLEFKVNTPSPEVLSRLLSSLANTQGGTVVIGVREPGEIVGIDAVRFERFAELARQRLEPKPELHNQVLDLNGKSIGIIRIERSEIPVAAREGYFKRIGDRDEPITAEQLVNRMSSVANHTKAIEALSNTITTQSTELAALRLSFEKSNSWQRKALYALLGAAATAIVKLILAATGLTDA
jgi:predicted HTH transcriptional regulator